MPVLENKQLKEMQSMECIIYILLYFARRIYGYFFTHCYSLHYLLSLSSSGCDGYDTRLCGGLNMALFWDIFFWCIPVFVFLLIPFMTFFYEADDGMLMAGTSIGAKPNSRVCEALKYEAVVVIIFGSLFAAGYLILGESSVPITNYRADFDDSETFTTPTYENVNYFDTSFLVNMTAAEFGYQDLAGSPANVSFESITVNVSISTFFAAFMAFVGWFFFAVFGGIGLAALPLDLILTFVNRPKHMDPAEFADLQMDIRNRTMELVDIGELLKIERDERVNTGGGKRGVLSGLSAEGRKERAAVLEFKKAVYLLETDVEDFLASSANYQNYNPIWPWMSLFGGILSIILSIAWIAQIVIYIAPPKPLHPFLNQYFQWFERWFPLFGVLSAAIFTLYLLLCAVKGCFKFGIRFMAMQIHPMKVHKTYMSSFMFNVGLVLLCALPVVQFTVTAFPEYARYTNVVQIMGTQVQYLKFFTWFWEAKIFIYAMLAFTVLTILYLSCKPADNNKAVQANKGFLGRFRRN